MELQIQRLDPELPLPRYAQPGDAGLDLSAAVDLVLAPGERAAIGTGLAVAIPEGYAGFVLPRSGRALKEGLGVANAPGLIDSGYRGEIKVIAVNLDASQAIEVKRGEKIAQLVIQPVANASAREVETLPASARGARGFGSTGR